MTSSPLTEKGNIYVQVVEQDKTFPTIPEPAWLGWWSLKYAPKRFKILLKNLGKFPLCFSMVSISCLVTTFSGILNWTQKKHGRRPTTAAKERGMWEKEKAKEKKREDGLSSKKHDSSEMQGRVLSDLKLFQLILDLKMSKTSYKRIVLEKLQMSMGWRKQ